MAINVNTTISNNYPPSMMINPNDSSTLEARKTRFMAINEAAEQESKVRSYKREEAQGLVREERVDQEGVSRKIAEQNEKNQREFSVRKAVNMYEQVKAQSEAAQESKAHKKYIENSKEYTKGSLISQYA
jgi:hypothetical protein